MTAAEIAEVLVDGPLDCLGRPETDRAGQTLKALAGRAALTAMSESVPGELVHLDIKKLGRISVRGAGHRVSGNRSEPDQGTPRRGVVGGNRLGVRACR